MTEKNVFRGKPFFLKNRYANLSTVSVVITICLVFIFSQQIAFAQETSSEIQQSFQITSFIRIQNSIKKIVDQGKLLLESTSKTFNKSAGGFIKSIKGALDGRSRAGSENPQVIQQSASLLPLLTQPSSQEPSSQEPSSRVIERVVGRISTPNPVREIIVNNIDNSRLLSIEQANKQMQQSQMEFQQSQNVLRDSLLHSAYINSIASNGFSNTGEWAGTFDGREGSYYLDARNSTNAGDIFASSLSATTTSALAEGTNLYFTANRVAGVLSATTTDALAEGATNLYYTPSRDIRFATTSSDYWLTTKTTDSLTPGHTYKYYATSLFAADLAATTTSALAEGSNLYWTDLRFDNRLSATTTLQNLTSIGTLTSLLVNGDIGIGTTTPSTKLAVQGNSLISGNLSAANITATGTLTLSGTSGTSTIAAGQGFSIGGTQLVLQQGSGYLGIGTSSPLRSLDVVGNFGGNVVVDNQILTANTTVTESTKALVYYLSNNTGTFNTNTTVTFNITGLPEVDGTIAFISARTIKGISANNRTMTVTLQINGVQISTVATPSQAAAATVIESYTAVRANGSWRMIGTPSVSDSADLAEWFPFTGDRPEEGDLVSFSNEAVRLQKSGSQYDQRLAGVVSTQPHTTMGPKTEDSIRLALAGRVPVKVSVENGAITIGDYLTSSSISGVAMKAMGPGVVIGRALESYDGLDLGSVMTLVGTEYYEGNQENFTDRIINIVKIWLGNMRISIEDGLVSLKNLVAEKITTNDLEVSSGITTRDRATGEYYCMYIENGLMKSELGKCGSSIQANILENIQPAGSSAASDESDTEAPVISVQGPDSIELERGTDWVDPGATVTDNVSENIGLYYAVNEIETGNGGRELPSIDTSVSGTYTITYSATDQAENKATASRAVTVLDSNSDSTSIDTVTSSFEAAISFDEPVLSQ